MSSSTSSWNADGLSQQDLMIKDECITVDFDDNIIGHASKHDAHIFGPKTPRGKLHRAFSVFLFNEEGKLLLQQRAADKITFPNVWTNTCCSHQLHGCTPNEVDDEKLVAQGKVDGAKAAAIRKLKHELGIDSKHVNKDSFKYLTRLHYWAADVVTHGARAPWGENEIDYILFIQTNVKLTPNLEEVKDYKYVTLDELKAMMAPSSGLLWSPWFRIMADKFLVHWWKDLKKTLTTDEYCDYHTIHRFDPTNEHMGGAGDARDWLGVHNSPYEKKTTAAIIGDKNIKQGAYGKVKIHKHSLFSQLSRPEEVIAGLYITNVNYMANKVDRSTESFRYCDDMLGKVSRSFAAVIRQLPTALCTDVLIFYLALRALDTIEDDMTAFKGNEKVKIQHLQTFYKTGLITEGWTMAGVGEGDEADLLVNYRHCVTVFKSLPKQSQEIIADITKRMGEGMASYVEKDLGQGTVTLQDYYLYCHYVAGLVGEGLSRLFTSSGYESELVGKASKTLANTMGLFLQKTNIIRDYLEDYVDGRAFWPQEVWKKYTYHDNLGELAEADNRDRAVQCLNEMVTDGLECVPECLQYLNLLGTEEVYRFCAIPQVMAIATLAELYNNPDVFTGVVKIRKGLAARMILDSNTEEGVYKWFYLMAGNISSRIPNNDPNAERTNKICQKILKITELKGSLAIMSAYWQIVSIFAPLIALATSWNFYNEMINRNLKWELATLRDYEIATTFSYAIFGWALIIGSVQFYYLAGSNKIPKADEVVSKLKLN